jgi:hypothetical protein
LRGRSEVLAVDCLQEELASPAPRRSRILSALEVLRGVTDVYDVARVISDWWLNPDLQTWISGLL